MALENIPPAEARQIQHIVELTRRQLQNRYPGDRQVLRGVHAKDHGCVHAQFEVLADLPTNLQQGLFANRGQKYSAIVRFSNAATLVLPDSRPADVGAPIAHGSRGMAIKILDVDGPMLEPVHGAPTQDFLLVNQPVFAFANVEDYEVLSQVLVDERDHPDAPKKFFAWRLPPPGTTSPTPSQLRAMESLKIVGRIQAPALPQAFQQPPASPVDNDYFGAAPFLFGVNHVMRFRVRPVARLLEAPNVADPNYLRTALISRLRNAQAGPVVFHFEVQVRAADSIDPDRDIENASHDWPVDQHCFQHVATLTVPLQEFDSPEQRLRCERLVFTPWHGLQAHRPLGGINRLRRAVYEASSMFRNLPKEPFASI